MNLNDPVDSSIDALDTRKAIYSVLRPLNSAGRFNVTAFNTNIRYSSIDIIHRHAHVPNMQLRFSDYGDDNFLYRVYIAPYDSVMREKIYTSHSIATIRSVSDAYGFADMLVFLDKHRPNDRSKK